MITPMRNSGVRKTLQLIPTRTVRRMIRERGRNRRAPEGQRRKSRGAAARHQLQVVRGLRLLRFNFQKQR